MTTVGIALELQPLAVIFNTVYDYEYHNFTCSYNSSQPLRIKLRSEPKLQEEPEFLAAPLYHRPSRYEYPYGETVKETLLLRRGHEYVRCALYDARDFAVANAYAFIRYNDFYSDIRK